MQYTQVLAMTAIWIQINIYFWGPQSLCKSNMTSDYQKGLDTTSPMVIVIPNSESLTVVTGCQDQGKK